MGYLHHALHSSSPLCQPLSCVSSFAWGCVQQRVEEPHSVPGYQVHLPEERSLEQPQEVRSACQPHMHAISSSAHRGGHRSVSFCRRTVEDRLPLERVPLACTFGSPLDLHVRQSLGLQGPVDLDHHRVELLIAHQQWFPMVVHNLTVHPWVGWGGSAGGWGRVGWRGWGAVRPWGGGAKVGGPTHDPLLPHAYLQGGCVSGAGLGKLLVAVVKQGLQMGRCVYSGCGDLHLTTNDICLVPRLANVALKTWMV